MINYTQIYSHKKSHHQFAAALRDNCPLLLSREMTSALSIAVTQSNAVTIATIIQYIANNPNRGYERQLDGLLHYICEMAPTSLDVVLDNSMIPYKTNVPDYSALKKESKCTVHESQVIELSEFVQEESKTKDIESVEFSTSAFTLDTNLRSKASGDLVDILVTTDHEQIMGTSVV